MNSTANHSDSTLPPLVPPAVLAQQLARDGAIRLVDVRTPAEHAAAHIRGSYNVPLDELPEHAAEIRQLTTPLVLVCQSGSRARRAESLLAGAGVPQLHVLDGGVQAWRAAGLPVVEGRGPISLERQVRIAAGSLAAGGGLLALFVHPLFAAIPAIVGSGLVFAGVTDTCGMAMVLAKLPYNRTATCDAGAVVKTLRAGEPADRAGAAAGSR